jgi:hypothetical protein
VDERATVDRDMAKRVRKELEQALKDSESTGIKIWPVGTTDMHFEASIQGASWVLGSGELAGCRLGRRWRSRCGDKDWGVWVGGWGLGPPCWLDGGVVTATHVPVWLAPARFPCRPSGQSL